LNVSTLYHRQPAPDIAPGLDYTGIDPFTKEEVYVAKGLRDWKRPQALMQFFKPENSFTVRETLIQADRADRLAIVRGGRLRVIRT
jgi:hypothetical protein